MINNNLQLDYDGGTFFLELNKPTLPINLKVNALDSTYELKSGYVTGKTYTYVNEAYFNAVNNIREPYLGPDIKKEKLMLIGTVDTSTKMISYTTVDNDSVEFNIPNTAQDVAANSTKQINVTFTKTDNKTEMESVNFIIARVDFWTEFTLVNDRVTLDMLDYDGFPYKHYYSILTGDNPYAHGKLHLRKIAR